MILKNARSQASQRPDRPTRRQVSPMCEALESRMVLSSATAEPIHAALANHHAIHPLQASNPPVIGTITGQVTKNLATKPLKNVQLQLIASNGSVIQTVKTNNKGVYKFKITAAGDYVVRQVTPNGFIQTTPTFTNVAPSGALNPAPNTWNYSTGNNNAANGSVGPYAWDTIAPAGNLPFESPINLTGPTTDLSSVLKINFNSSVPTDITNSAGHQFQVQYPTTNTSNTITVNGVTSNLVNFHFHDPSEHTVYGAGYPMELHFVNVNPITGAESVVGVFLQLGPHNNALDPILSAIQGLAASNSKTTLPAVAFAGLLPTNTQGWYYEGSLTTPPLSQTVNWFVFSTPITLDFAQLLQYEAAAKAGGFLPNNRPQQPTDGRQFNEINYDVNFQTAFTMNLNFNDEHLLQS
jgi:carbonic anhydrase